METSQKQNFLSKSEMYAVNLGPFDSVSQNKQHVWQLLTPRSIEWYRPPHYDISEPSCYGNVVGRFAPKRMLLLLNLGSQKVREDIVELTSLSTADIDPDIMYEHRQNLFVHQVLRDGASFSAFDGTFISEQLIDPDLLSFLAGPEEVVLFHREGVPSVQLTDVYLK